MLLPFSGGSAQRISNMPSRMYNKGVIFPGIGPGPRTQCNQHWGHSPKVDGRLQLRAIPCTMEFTQNYAARFRPSFFGPNTNTIAYLSSGWDLRDLQASSYAKFRGKLYSGNAQLGVTFASWRQSRDMIAKRSRPIATQASELFNEISKSPAAQRALARRRGDKLGDIAQLRALSGLHLEVIFGWQPLVQDIHNACMTVIQSAAQTTWVRGSSTGFLSQSGNLWMDGFGGVNSSKDCMARVTRAAGVRVNNPNLWLAERAGLINPAAVAWDLVPWSFVVNMFSNVGGLVNSITDFAGLEFINASETTTLRVTLNENYLDHLGRSAATLVSQGRFKYRSGRADAPPPLIWKVPDLNWETAAMACSLAFGKVRTLSKLL